MDAESRSTSVSIRELLAESAWVRGLARSLVLDHTAADDVAQQSLIAAWQRPPRDADKRRSWLRRVVGNFARQAARARTRQTARERLRATEGVEEATDEIVARFELHRLLANEVALLQEPYRSTVVLHFFQCVPLNRMAQYQKVPASTTRWRLQRALALLRARLDEAYQGERKDWCLALAPVCGEVSIAGKTATSFVATALSAKGILIVLATSLTLLTLVLLAVFGIRSNEDSPSPDGEIAAVAPQEKTALEPDGSEAAGSEVEEERHWSDEANRSDEAKADDEEAANEGRPPARKPVSAAKQRAPSLVAHGSGGLGRFTPESPPPGMAYVEGGPFRLGLTRDQLGQFVDKMLGRGRKPKPLMTRALIAKRKQTQILPAFFIDTYEVTNAQYRLFVDATGTEPPSNWEHGVFEAGRGNVPVTMVSLRDAKMYARWVGKSVPTELEWEKAARGTDGRWFPWGDEWNDKGLCNNGLQPPADLSPVGQFRDGASPYKVHDMAGNVWEWTDTYISPYGGNEDSPAFNSARGYVVRGGCYRNVTHELATFIRNSAPPENGFEAVGFRCARSIKPGVDIARHALIELSSQLPPGSGIDPEDAVGVEWVETQEATDYVVRAAFFAIAPVGELNYSTKDALDRDAKKKKNGSVVLAILSTDLAIAEPRLAPGCYALFYQRADPRRADRETSRKPKAEKDNLLSVAAYDRFVYIDVEGSIVAEVRNPAFENTVGIHRKIDFADDLRVSMVIDPKFGSRALAFPLVFKILR